MPTLVIRDVGGLGDASSGSASTLTPAAYPGDVLGIAAFSPTLAIQRDATGKVSGISTLGLGTDETSITVDGADVRGLRLPRDARIAARVSTSTYDPSQGGFSGARVEFAAAPGTNMQARTFSAYQTASAEGGASTATSSLSSVASGYLILDRLFYSSSVELTGSRRAADEFQPRRATDYVAIGADPSVANDLIAGISGIGFDPRVARHSAAFTIATLNRFDLVTDSTRSTALIVRGAVDRTEPFGASPFQIGAPFASASGSDAGLSLQHTVTGARASSETVLSLARSSNSLSPSETAPFVSIRLPGATAATEVSNQLRVGSSLDQVSTSRQASARATETIRWVTRDGHHRAAAGAALRVARDTRDPQLNTLGEIAFDSVPALLAKNPSAYTRIFNVGGAMANMFTGSAFLGDVWTPRARLSVQGGARIDLNGFSLPGADDNVGFVDARLPLNSVTSARSIDVSPRLGATWDKPVTRSGWLTGYTLRGGAGRFVNDVRSDYLLPASVAYTGRNAPQRLDCVEGNVPTLPWGRFGADASPRSCLDGNPPTSLTLPGSVIAGDWKPPSTLRGNLGAAFRTKHSITLSVDVTHSVTHRITSIVDANLAEAATFLLPRENARPVFATPAAIATGSLHGSVNPQRVDSELGPSNYVVSDMRSVSDQVVATLEYWNIGGTNLGFGYAYTRARDLARWNDGGTGGDPRTPEWGPASFAPTHVVTARAFKPFGARVLMSARGRIQSGVRYAPRVIGDVNGDGRFDDRAYVPLRSGSPRSDLSDRLTSLLPALPSEARDCLVKLSGTIAGRNACSGPWTASLDVSLIAFLGNGSVFRRPSLKIDLVNIPSGMDLLANSARQMRGWGGNGRPDDVLLTVSGFDAVTKQFKYAVNPTFGSTRSTAASENPLTVRVGVTVPLSADPSSQLLAIDAKRKAHPSAEVLLGRYLGEYPNAALEVLRLADTVSLRPAQRDSLTILARSFDETMQLVWLPVAKRVSSGTLFTRGRSPLGECSAFARGN